MSKANVSCPVMLWRALELCRGPLLAWRASPYVTNSFELLSQYIMQSAIERKSGIRQALILFMEVDSS